MKRLLRLMALLLLAWPACGWAFQFSVCVHLALGRSQAQGVDNAVAAAGLDAFRDDVYWDSIEHPAGRLVFPQRFERIVEAARLARARGARPLIVLSYGSRHYDNGGLVVSDAGRDAFERYARFVVRRFGDLVDQYEVWNEWNSGFGSNPRQSKGDATQYAQLLARTARAIKQENPAAQVIGGAVAGLDYTWIKSFIDAGGLDHLDAFSVHSYTLFQLRDNPESALRGLESVNTLLKRARPARVIPVLITEMGWPTNTGRYGVSEATAASYLARFMLMARSRPWIGGVWWYDLFDDGDAADQMEHRFGLLRRDGRPKPAYAAAQRIAPLVRPPGPVAAYRMAGGVYVVHGQQPGTEWVAAWRVDAAVLQWAWGSWDVPEAPAALQQLAGSAVLSGEPTFWRKESTGWIREAPLLAR